MSAHVDTSAAEKPTVDTGEPEESVEVPVSDHAMDESPHVEDPEVESLIEVSNESPGNNFEMKRIDVNEVTFT